MMDVLSMKNVPNFRSAGRSRKAGLDHIIVVSFYTLMNLIVTQVTILLDVAQVCMLKIRYNTNLSIITQVRNHTS